MPSGLPKVYFDTVFTIDDSEIAIPCHFAIVTAFNPMDRRCTPTQNRSADLDLKERLDDEKLEAFRVTGCSPDRSHAEPGWGLPVSLDRALEIAREYHQRAIWWIENDELHLVDCSNPEPVPIARFSDRIVVG